MSAALLHSDDFHLAQECLDGQRSALVHLQQAHQEPLLAFLQRSGAAAAEAREVVSELWADLVASHSGKIAKLARYDGTCALQTWLNTVALNDLITRKRRAERWNRIIPNQLAMGGCFPDSDGGGAVEAPSQDVATEFSLIEILRAAVEAAFLACPAEDFVLLQLAHCDRLKVQELAVMFRCNAGTISRRVQKAEAAVSAETLDYIQAADPWLELRWEDLVELCRTATPTCFGAE